MGRTKYNNMDDPSYPWFGIQPYNPRGNTNNIPEFRDGLTGCFKVGETYTLTYDPKKSELTISGGRLKKEIRKSITRGIYFPLCFMYPIIGQEMHIAMELLAPED